MSVFGKMWSYLSFKKQDVNTRSESSSFNLKAMHTINKISLFMFLAGALVLVMRWVVF